MKQTLCMFALLAASLPSASQARNPSASPDLRRFPSSQLIACFDDKTICGTDNIDAISDELTRRLPGLSSDEMVACFADWRVCGVGNGQGSGFAVSAEVARRGNPDALLDRYWTEPNPDIRDGIVHVAYRFHSKKAIAFMRKVLAAGQGDEDALYWPASYLAKRCDPGGLKWLSEGQGRPEGCIVFTGTVRAFGKCHYRPAIPYLIENSMQDACLNIGDDAAYSLEKLYPDHPARFDSLEAEQKYYCGRALQEGFKVDCSAK